MSWWKLIALALGVLAYNFGFRGDSTPQVTDIIHASYDYVIVGSGAAGSVVAARLSEDPSLRVLVLEAGDDDLRYPSIRVPGKARDMWMSSATWDDYTVPQKNACLGMKSNQCRWPHGRVLGGGTSVNFMLYVRGSRHDYDGWSKSGCEGWSYEEVLPFFKKSESMQDSKLKNSEYHGYNGPIVVQDRPISPIGDLFVRAAEELGYRSIDINGAEQEGFSRVHYTINNGVRSSTAAAYLRPAMTRPNLDVATLAPVKRVIFDGKRATGVEFMWRGENRQVSVNKEVILSAGALDSPKILMLSGVGPKQHLQEHNIPLVADLPVGKNLQDHLQMDALVFTIDRPVSITPKKASALWPQALYSLNGEGLLGASGVHATGVLRSKHQPKDDPVPYMQLIALSIPCNDDVSRRQIIDAHNYREEVIEMLYGKLNNQEALAIGGYLNHPLSRGELLLQSNKSSDRPLFDPHYLENQIDVDVLKEVFRLAQQFGKTKTMRDIGAKQLPVPHPYCGQHEYESDAFWECIVRHDTKTVFHHSGTCKMGAKDDEAAVVDPQLRVRGLEGIRVIDASIMPNVTAGNIMMATIMIGEKGADLIRSAL
ncbi:hypothetical protein CAPTEDRAFT_227635 [Capitella teleta]|uniref:Glucose-methanol-choline oxidoreductase N-terminal domain-containing protein n=1 Tax=Capitella teleta TaxID=283909 RepID=R7VLL4_CAPTE|nr:hypothetical protein CAPTEDRAFT_227635 [Capitella teleta]|eukprot:ELU18401.1 hypothetical protein CAPTEDRAFT_227635 [Capitella teleta]